MNEQKDPLILSAKSKTQNLNQKSKQATLANTRSAAEMQTRNSLTESKTEKSAISNMVTRSPIGLVQKALTIVESAKAKIAANKDFRSRATLATKENVLVLGFGDSIKQTASFYLLAETGDYLTTEAGDRLLLEY